MPEQDYFLDCFRFRSDIHDMDRGAEQIENIILGRSAKLRENWLLFDSFKKIHVEAQQKKRHQVFDTVLGGAAGSNL